MGLIRLIIGLFKFNSNKWTSKDILDRYPVNIKFNVMLSVF